MSFDVGSVKQTMDSAKISDMYGQGRGASRAVAELEGTPYVIKFPINKWDTEQSHVELATWRSAPSHLRRFLVPIVSHFEMEEKTDHGGSLRYLVLVVEKVTPVSDLLDPGGEEGPAIRAMLEGDDLASSLCKRFGLGTNPKEFNIAMDAMAIGDIHVYNLGINTKNELVMLDYGMLRDEPMQCKSEGEPLSYSYFTGGRYN